MFELWIIPLFRCSLPINTYTKVPSLKLGCVRSAAVSRPIDPHIPTRAQLRLGWLRSGECCFWMGQPQWSGKPTNETESREDLPGLVSHIVVVLSRTTFYTWNRHSFPFIHLHSGRRKGREETGARVLEREERDCKTHSLHPSTSYAITDIVNEAPHQLLLPSLTIPCTYKYPSRSTKSADDITAVKSSRESPHSLFFLHRRRTKKISEETCASFHNYWLFMKSFWQEKEADLS